MHVVYTCFTYKKNKKYNLHLDNIGGQMTKVSVIVPVYNVEKFLKRCLDSIINQTLKDIEIICIYYNSNDKTLEILEQIASKDSRITVIMQRTKGQAGARNEGTDIATGEYIGFVDSDDWIDLDFYEKLYNSAKKYDADIAVGSIIRLHKYNKKYHLKIWILKVSLCHSRNILLHYILNT